MTSAIEVRNLIKEYGDTVAVSSVTFDVDRHEILGLVGPNGAGKTTTVECVEGLRRPTAGRIRVLGMDPAADRRALAERVGVQLQESALPARLRVGEALALFGSFYARSSPIESLLERFDLTGKRTAPFGTLSGGQKQRLFIALALVGLPELVFFDELTTGLDPQARHAMWDLVRAVREGGCTVVLTTHYMEEAERLCDRVLIMDRGRVVAMDTPERLIERLGADTRVKFVVGGDRRLPDLGRLPQVRRVEQTGGRVVVYGRGERFAGAVVTALDEAAVAFRDLRTEQPDLEDVFLALTGREMPE